jgi:hypothetical protein
MRESVRETSMFRAAILVAAFAVLAGLATVPSRAEATLLVGGLPFNDDAFADTVLS